MQCYKSQLVCWLKKKFIYAAVFDLLRISFTNIIKTHKINIYFMYSRWVDGYVC